MEFNLSVENEFNAWSEGEREIYVKGINFGIGFLAGFQSSSNKVFTFDNLAKLSQDELEIGTFQSLVLSLSKQVAEATKKGS